LTSLPLFCICLLCYFKLWIQVLPNSAHRHVNYLRSIYLRTDNTRLISLKFTYPILSSFKVDQDKHKSDIFKILGTVNLAGRSLLDETVPLRGNNYSMTGTGLVSHSTETTVSCREPNHLTQVVMTSSKPAGLCRTRPEIIIKQTTVGP
jgi:hypothetical protein